MIYILLGAFRFIYNPVILGFKVEKQVELLSYQCNITQTTSLSQVEFYKSGAIWKVPVVVISRTWPLQTFLVISWLQCSSYL